MGRRPIAAGIANAANLGPTAISPLAIASLLDLIR
jgi:hypothetical protein